MSEKERYAKYLCSPEWWSKRNAVMHRSSGLCEKCGDIASHVHHLTYIRKYNESLADLQALCERCHNAIHNARVISVPVTVPNDSIGNSVDRITRERLELIGRVDLAESLEAAMEAMKHEFNDEGEELAALQAVFDITRECNTVIDAWMNG